MKKQISIFIVLSMILCLMPSVVHAVHLQTYCEGHLDLPDGYTYLQIPFTAPDDGVFTIQLSNLTPGTEIGFGLKGNPEYTQYDIGDTVITYEVIGGATYELEFWGYDFAAGYHAASSFDYYITYTGNGTVEPYVVPQWGETAGMPISLRSEESNVTIPAGKSYYFTYSPAAPAMEQILTICGESGFEVMIEQWDDGFVSKIKTVYPDQDGVIEVLLSSVTGAYNFVIANHRENDVEYVITLSDVEPDLGDGTAENPFVVNSFPYEIVVDAGRYDLYYTFTPETDGVITISYPAGNFVSGLKNFQKDEDLLLYTVEVYAGVPVTFCPCGDYEGTYVVTWIDVPSDDDFCDAYQGSGTLEDPYWIESLPADLQFTIMEGDNDIFFKYIVQEDGILSLRDCTCVSMVIINGEWVNSSSVSVVAGMELLLNFYADTPGNHSVSIVYAEPAPEKLPLSGSVTFDVPSEDHAVVLVDVSAAGSIHVVISGEPGFIFDVLTPAGELLDIVQVGAEEERYTFQVSEAGVYQIRINAYDPLQQLPAAGTVVYDIAFAAEQVEPEKPEIEISDVIIHEPGSFDIPLMHAHVTVFTFYPMQSGVYQITVGNNVLIGYYGGNATELLNMADVQHAVTFQWLCTEEPVIEYETILDPMGDPFEIPHLISGQKAMIGIISGGTSAVVTIERLGDYVPPLEETMEWTQYVPEEEPEVVAPTEENDYIGIDVADDISSILVLGEDGYYHYGTSDGPVVVIDLSVREGFYLDFSAATAEKTIGYFLYVNDELVTKFDCGAYLTALQQLGPVALTEEILNVVQNVGQFENWWAVAFDGAYAEHPNSWMALCSYVEGTENDSTGDGIAIVLGLLIASAMGICVLKRRMH